MRNILTFAAAAALSTTLILASSTSFAKGHNNGVKDVVAGVKSGEITIEGGIGKNAPVAPGDGDAAETDAIDRNSKDYTSFTGNPGRSPEGGLPGLKR